MYRRMALLTVVLVLLSLACRAAVGIPGSGGVIRGSGDVTSETRRVSGFDEIDVCCGMQLILTQGDTESLEIEAEDNLLPEIVSSVVGGKLVIRYKDDTGSTQYLPTQPIRCTVTAREIRGLEISGGGILDAGDIDADSLSVGLSGGSVGSLASVIAGSLVVSLSGGSNFSAQELDLSRLTLDLSGGSSVSIDAFIGDSLSLDGSGGGETTIAGNVTEQDIGWSGGGRYDAGDLESMTTTIDMSGGGAATLWVNGSLDARLSGGAQVEYYGSPSTQEDLSGGSTLESLGEH